MEQEAFVMYEKEGQINGVISGIVALVAGVAVITLILIMTGVLGGQAYNLAETDIENISDATIKAYVKEGIQSGFKAQKQTGSYLPLIVLAIIITVVLSLILGLSAMSGGGMRGSAL